MQQTRSDSIYSDTILFGYFCIHQVIFSLTCSLGLLGLCPVLESQCARWKGIKASPLHSLSYMSSHLSMGMLCISMGQPCSLAIKISAETTWPGNKKRQSSISQLTKMQHEWHNLRIFLAYHMLRITTKDSFFELLLPSLFFGIINEHFSREERIYS